MENQPYDHATDYQQHQQQLHKQGYHNPLPGPSSDRRSSAYGDYRPAAHPGPAQSFAAGPQDPPVPLPPPPGYTNQPSTPSWHQPNWNPNSFHQSHHQQAIDDYAAYQHPIPNQVGLAAGLTGREAEYQLGLFDQNPNWDRHPPPPPPSHNDQHRRNSIAPVSYRSYQSDQLAEMYQRQPSLSNQLRAVSLVGALAERRTRGVPPWAPALTQPIADDFRGSTLAGTHDALLAHSAANASDGSPTTQCATVRLAGAGSEPQPGRPGRPGRAVWPLVPLASSKRPPPRWYPTPAPAAFPIADDAPTQPAVQRPAAPVDQHPLGHRGRARPGPILRRGEAVGLRPADATPAGHGPAGHVQPGRLAAPPGRARPVRGRLAPAESDLRRSLAGRGPPGRVGGVDPKPAQREVHRQLGFGTEPEPKSPA